MPTAEVHGRFAAGQFGHPLESRLQQRRTAFRPVRIGAHEMDESLFE